MNVLEYLPSLILSIVTILYKIVYFPAKSNYIQKRVVGVGSNEETALKNNMLNTEYFILNLFISADIL